MRSEGGQADREAESKRKGGARRGEEQWYERLQALVLKMRADGDRRLDSGAEQVGIGVCSRFTSLNEQLV